MNLLKKILILGLILTSLQSNASYEVGLYSTVHINQADTLAHIGDDRTTINPMLKYRSGDLSIFFFLDSIHSPALGVSKKVWSKGVFGLDLGFYHIDTQNWRDHQIKQFWLEGGFVPVIAPSVEIPVGNNLKIHSFFNFDYISTGIVFQF